ncbi:MAG: zf-TFIIB domain-containing protein [Vulcanimicrobiota bacterium]
MGLIGKFIEDLFSAFTGRIPPTKAEPVCPECATVLERFHFGTSSGHRCSRCSGLFISSDLFTALLEAPRNELSHIAPDGNLSLHTFNRSDDMRECPSCEKKMENYQFAYSSGIWIDACPDRHGVWLDACELAMVRDFNDNVNTPSTPEERYIAAASYLDASGDLNRKLTRVEREIDTERRRHEGSFRRSNF